MDWVDMVERERENHEAMLERINDIVVCTCNICGKELHHGEEAYQICDYDVYMCEHCCTDKMYEEIKPGTKCERCGSECDTMFEMNDAYYCENCIESVELCADEDEINSIKYHINYDED